MPIPEIILASASPRRQALLRQVGLPFATDPSGIPEPIPATGDPVTQALAAARAKAEAVAPRHPGDLILAADTVVESDGHLLGKPRDAVEARRMLERLSGQTHRVVTGVVLFQAATGRQAEAAEVTAVTFRPLRPLEIDAYVQSGEPFGKAGGYAIQGRGALLVERIAGCYTNVVGLPLTRLQELLGRFGVDVWRAGAGASKSG